MARPRSMKVHTAALDAALDLVLENGLDSVTMEEVATRSGVAKSTLYRHFGDLDTLLADAVVAAVVPGPTPDTGDLATDLMALFTQFGSSEESKRLGRLLVLLTDASHRSVRMEGALAKVLAEKRRPLRTVLTLAQHRGQVDPNLDLDLAMALLLGPFTYRREIEKQEITADFAVNVAARIVHALAARESDLTPVLSAAELAQQS